MGFHGSFLSSHVRVCSFRTPRVYRRLTRSHPSFDLFFMLWWPVRELVEFLVQWSNIFLFLFSSFDNKFCFIWKVYSLFKLNEISRILLEIIWKNNNLYQAQFSLNVLKKNTQNNSSWVESNYVICFVPKLGTYF